MKYIPLTQGKYATVDDEDYGRLIKYKWFAQINHCGIYYAVSKKGKMHRIIMGLKKGDKRIIDHINKNSLDNRKQNLRICTNKQNCWNSKGRGGSSKYKGVTYHKISKRWQAQMTHNYKHIRCGSYLSEIEAAKAYDEKTLELRGEYASLNFPEANVELRTFENEEVA